jgi:hypothetical protein
MSLYRVVVSLARGMGSDNGIVCASAPYRDAAARLASYGSGLFGWMDAEWGHENLDVETLAGFASFVFNGLRMGHDRDRNFGLIVRRLLDSQLADGSWGLDQLPADAEMGQEDYLRRLYQTTWACVDGLRPRRHDPPACRDADRPIARP